MSPVISSNLTQKKKKKSHMKLNINLLLLYIDFFLGILYIDLLWQINERISKNHPRIIINQVLLLFVLKKRLLIVEGEKLKIRVLMKKYYIFLK